MPGPRAGKALGAVESAIVVFFLLRYTEFVIIPDKKAEELPLTGTPDMNGQTQPCGVQVLRLGCQRGERLLFSNININLGAGSALVLTGPNGAGKTSLLRILAGLLRADAGTVKILPFDDERALGQSSCFVGGRDALKQGLTPRETLMFQLSLMADPVRPHADVTHADMIIQAAIGAFGLDALAEMPNGWLSSGQRKRVALARLILCGMSRPLWLLDEPTNALDAQACAHLAAVVAIHRRQGGIVIAATHQPLGWPDAAELRLGETS